MSRRRFLNRDLDALLQLVQPTATLDRLGRPMIPPVLSRVISARTTDVGRLKADLLPICDL